MFSYSDTDWPGFSYNWHSTVGFVAFLGSNLIIWRVKKQQNVLDPLIEKNMEILPTHLLKLLGFNMFIQSLVYTFVNQFVWCVIISLCIWISTHCFMITRNIMMWIFITFVIKLVREILLFNMCPLTYSLLIILQRDPHHMFYVTICPSFLSVQIEGVYLESYNLIRTLIYLYLSLYMFSNIFI